MVILQKQALRRERQGPESAPTVTRYAQTAWRQGAPVRLNFYPTRAVVQRELDPAYDVGNYRHYLSTQTDAVREEFEAAGNSEPAPSEILRASLIASDVRVPTAGTPEAHHIVESRNIWGRALLQAVRIDSNSAANGVFLPSCSTDDTGNASIHHGSHENNYLRCVNQSLARAVGLDHPIELFTYLIPKVRTDFAYYLAVRGSVLLRLEEIRDVLLTCNVPLNVQGDPNWTTDDQNDHRESIEDIFQQNDLI